VQLTRCQDQHPETLDDFYGDLARSENVVTRRSGETMLHLIKRLRALPNERRVYGLTSLSRLCLKAEDTSDSSWSVIVSVLDERNYFIEYLMPDRLAPWPNAYVKGEAGSEDEAVQMILTAIERSEGWSRKK
jgi:hypothetical protein